MIVGAEEGRATLGRRRAANQQTKQLVRVGIGDGANARKEDMVKLTESKKVGTTFRVNPDASATSMARKHKQSSEVMFSYMHENGRKFTPQQTKNLLKRIGNNKSSQDRLKMLLDALAQVEGNEVMLKQDQFDVTCGIVIQTSAQKLCFEHWGQTLAMDWTHSTNNLGFHLGSLVATGPSGRGIPVFDFMAVNEKAKKLKVIFEYFKSNNPGWQQVRSFVIDKHFVEWRMLEKYFPSSTVLLCQFLAIAF
ncbi:hypothetical protein PC113_g13351 [Phytophthora cactorum]|uniref:ZSWIM1/3 RNaseH-like domain-containing protein n=1 Tax=Phytophthora cactorum TaxID=29920 RepID=A0A8T0YXK4_9STRA|nr:hypothetical protein PC113_g13351 [Phytophthora cactorum]KAG2907363.1 hypothetical protein PC115_g13964 [Phytophthora cactorum]